MLYTLSCFQGTRAKPHYIESVVYPVLRIGRQFTFNQIRFKDTDTRESLRRGTVVQKYSKCSTSSNEDTDLT